MSGRRLPRPARSPRTRAVPAGLSAATVAVLTVAVVAVFAPMAASPAAAAAISAVQISAVQIPALEIPVPNPDPALTPLPTPTPSTPTPAYTPVPMPVPVPTPRLPFTADVVPSYQSQASCDPAAKPGVEAYVRMVLQTYRVGRNGGIVRGCGIGSTSEHKEGRAFDYMLSVNVPGEKAAGDALTTWLTGPDANGVQGGNARRLGVMYVIWNRKFWSSYAMGTGWRRYTGPNPHTDHIHTSFSWDGAEGRTSWWTGRAVSLEDKGPCRVYAGQPAPVYTTPRFTSCPTLLAAPTSSYGIVWPGQSSSVVKVAQARLGLVADGVFGLATRQILMGWQRQAAVPVTGVLDKPTWARLAPSLPPVGIGLTPTPTPTSTPTSPPTTTLPAVPVVVLPTTALTAYKATVLRPGSRGSAVKGLQRAVEVTADGVFGSSTTMAVAAAQTREGLRGTGVVDATTWAAIERLAYPLLSYRSTTLRRFSTGPAVLVLERALKMSADTSFGPATQAAVKNAQGKAKLPQTGVVDGSTWAAIEAQAFPLGVLRPSAAALARATGLTPYTTVTVRRGAGGLVVQALQQALGIKADGMFGSGTLSSVRAFQGARRLPVTGVVDTRTWGAVELAAYPLLPYRLTVLKAGSRGPAVMALQKALRQKADGTFGSSLVVAVKAAQRKARLSPTGTVTTPTWVSIEKVAYPLGVRRW